MQLDDNCWYALILHVWRDWQSAELSQVRVTARMTALVTRTLLATLLDREVCEADQQCWCSSHHNERGLGQHVHVFACWSRARLMVACELSFGARQTLGSPCREMTVIVARCKTSRGGGQ